MKENKQKTSIGWKVLSGILAAALITVSCLYGFGVGTSNAKNVNGKANATAKPNIPTVGPIIFVVAISTNKNPMIGPVQEKETKDKVNAIRNMLNKPVVLLALLSTALLHDDGRVISNPPKKDAPNTTNIKKKKILNIALVDKALRALAPKSKVTNKPKAT